MPRNERPIIVVKRIKKQAHAHHGGAWKIAYADFVTAMMAFFLLMWLLGSTSQGSLKGIADYFKSPLYVAMQGGSGSGDSSSIIKGGGKDLTRNEGQVKYGDIRDPDHRITLKTSPRDSSTLRSQDLLALQARIERLIQENPATRPYRRQILLGLTEDGLRIQIVDTQSRPMFDLGGSRLKPYAAPLLHAIGQALNNVDFPIALSGHTDATHYTGGQAGYSNWELSTDRANAARRELVAGGMKVQKIVRVVGLADAYPLNSKDPLDPMNRRISLLVLNKPSTPADRTVRRGEDVAAVLSGVDG